jgi:tetratricopeptide (TPR) repeat protein
MEQDGQKCNVEGELEEVPFPSILQFLHERNATGRLVLRRGEITKVVFMVDGCPVNVDSTLRDETLGRYLIKKGKITEEEFESSIPLMIEHNIQQGAALVKLEILSAKELYHEVKAQTREKFLSCFAWTTGFFGFYADVEFVEDIYRFEMSVPQALHQGIKRFFPPGAVEIQLARVSPGPIGPLPGFIERIGDYELDDEESAFVLLIDGQLDIKNLRKKGEEFPSSSKLLYLLLVTGLAGPEGKPEKNLRSLSVQDLELPPIEDFVITTARETSPEVVEEHELDEMEVVTEEEAAAAAPESGHKMVPSEDEIIDELDFQATGNGIEMTYEEEEIEEETPETAQEEIPPRGKSLAEGADIEQEPLPDDRQEGMEDKDESEILEYYVGIKGIDFFSLLKIDPDADDQQIKAAYHNLRQKYHRNNFKPELSEEALAKLEEIHTQIIRAYETLRTAKKRLEYKRHMDEKEKKPKELKPELKAEQYLQKGLLSVRKRDWPNAVEMFKNAIEANPEEPEYLGYLGWSTYSDTELDSTERTRRAKDFIRRAIEMNPYMDSAHVFLAKILKNEGEVKEAAHEFETALLCNPKCREAERELKSHEQGEW